ncbi:MAG: exo-alpha-sialidase, partial [Saprospiraceae bacterium]|nr:exo-alpha-sialidase [Saprospiraceae bacterium]
MRVLFPFLTAFFFVLISSAQNGITWLDPIKLGSVSDGASSVRIDMLSNGDPLVMLGQGSGRNIKVIRIVDGIPQSPSFADKGGLTPRFFSFAGLDMATHADSVYIVFESGSNLYLAKSNDGGQTFFPPVLAFEPPDNKIATLSSIEVDDQGNPLIATLWETASEQEARYATVYSDNGGDSFLPFVVASEPAEGTYVCECCPSDILMEGDEVFLAFRNNPGNRRDIWVSQSVDNGSTYSSAVDVDDTDWNISFCPISKPSIHGYRPDTILVAFHSGASGKGRVYLNYFDRTNQVAGESYQFPLTSNGSQNSPILAGEGDTLGMVWVENGFSGTGADLMFALSKTGRKGLEQNIGRIAALNQNQENPALAYDDGFFHLIFTDASGLWYQKGIVDNSSGIFNPVANQTSFSVYPQPATGTIFNVAFDEPLLESSTIRLLDIDGKEI